MKCLIASEKSRDIGNLVLRIAVGLLFVNAGWGKITNPDMWPQLGSSMGNLGISFAPSFWGFMAAISEFGGGICLILGLLVRPASTFMAFTMLVALTVVWPQGPMTQEAMGKAMPALLCLIIFVSLMLTGPGKCSLDAKVSGACQAKL
jgi:putative oxidoreductase